MAGGVITLPDYPQMGVPSGTKQEGQRVDFRPTQFDLAIETKGYLLAWERSTICPCAPIVAQTEQPDPTCELCSGSGVIYFSAPNAQDLSEYDLDPIQQQILDDSGAMVIRGLIMSVQSQPDPVDSVTRRTPGTAQLTVRHENTLGYYDRITALDAEIVFAETLVADGESELEARYLITGINYLRSVDTVYAPDVDYEILAGKIKWYAGREPVADTRVTIHYLCHPSWLIIEHPHAARVTLNKFKVPAPKSPAGDPRKLPVQALIRYEFLQEV